MTNLRMVVAGVFVIGWSAFTSNACAAHDHTGHEKTEHSESADDHNHHNHHDHADGPHEHTPPQNADGYEKSLEHYDIPNVTLIDQFARPVRVDKLFKEDRPTLVQFIFTSCSTICPVMGAVFGGAQDDIAEVAPNYRMISISIDPEYDTPEMLREFAAKQNAGEDWVFLTGSDADVKDVIKAFDVLYQGDNKMYHQPYTFIRWRPDEDWTRIRGLMGVADLTAEFEQAGS